MLVTIAPVEGQKWKQVWLHQEWKEDTEEAEEDPDEGPSTKPQSLRKATGKTKRQEEESKEKEITVTTTHQPLKMTEIWGSRKEFAQHPHGPIVTW